MLSGHAPAIETEPRLPYMPPMSDTTSPIISVSGLS